MGVALALVGASSVATGGGAGAQYCEPGQEQTDLSCLTDGGDTGGGGDTGDDGDDDGDSSNTGSDTGGSPSGDGSTEDSGSTDAPAGAGAGPENVTGSSADLAAAILDSISPDLTGRVLARVGRVTDCRRDIRPGQDILDACAPDAARTFDDLFDLLRDVAADGSRDTLFRQASLVAALGSITRADGTVAYPAANRAAPLIVKLASSPGLDARSLAGIERWAKLILALDLQQP